VGAGTGGATGPVVAAGIPAPGYGVRELPGAVGAARAAGIAGNAVYFALFSVTLPLLLAAHGVGKTALAVFFLVNAVGGALLHVTVGRRALTRLPVRAALPLCALLSAGGMAAVTLGAGGPALLLAGVAVMASTLNYPRLLTEVGTGDARAVAATRLLFVIGYLLGTGLFAALSAGGVRVAAYGAVAASLVNAGVGVCTPAAPRASVPVSAAASRGGGAGRGEARRGGAQGGGARRGGAVLAATLGAVLLLRGSDSLRQVYLPLYAVAIGLPGPLLSTLFAVTAAGEAVLLLPLAHLGRRAGTRRALCAVAAAGCVSFAAVACGGGYPVLVCSQLAYAFFTAGLQTTGLLLVQETTPGGPASGASVFMAVTQLGSTLGILAPLAVPGYSPAVFALPVAFCLAALLALLPGARAAGTARTARTAGRRQSRA
jgi:hypothetical protein